MHLVLDSETSGFRENRLVQLGAILIDPSFRPIQEVSLLVRPDNWTIEQGAFEVHGISDSHIQKFGLPLDVVLGVLLGMMREAEVVVCHNAAFDIDRVIDPELSRAKWPKFNRQRFCTMEFLTRVCKLPASDKQKKAGFGGYKKPKLSEAYRYAFGEDFEGTAHDAITDARATARLYQWIKSGMVKLPYVPREIRDTLVPYPSPEADEIFRPQAEPSVAYCDVNHTCLTPAECLAANNCLLRQFTPPPPLPPQ